MVVMVSAENLCLQARECKKKKRKRKEILEFPKEHSEVITFLEGNLFRSEV